MKNKIKEYIIECIKELFAIFHYIDDYIDDSK